MKKQNIINLVKYHYLKDDNSFRNEVYELVRYFSEIGDNNIAQHLLSLMKDVNVLKPQDYDYSHFNYLFKDTKKCTSIIFPDDLSEDILSIVNSINKSNGIHRFLFHGQPGTGKTEACRHIARLSQRDLIIVNCEEIVDSHLGQTPKNIVELFNEINKLMFENVIILFDEIDSLVLDRLNSNDLREMGRATSTFIKQLDLLSDDIVLIATTNLKESIDQALLRRLGASISFDRYKTEDLYYLADKFLSDCLSDGYKYRVNSVLMHKIIKNASVNVNPGELKNAIKLSVSFSSDGEYEYLSRLFKILIPNVDLKDIKKLAEMNFTMREIEILTAISKSSVSRKLMEVK